jgi:hypothetical protein
MPRRAFLPPALLVAAAMAFGGCGNSTPALSDPGEILTKAVEALQKAKSVHLEATVDGTLVLDLLGTGEASNLAVTGTSLGADLDIENGNADLKLAVPALLGLTADVIVVGEETYIKSTLTGPKFQRGSTTDPGLPIDPTDPKQSLKDLQEWLAKPEVDPKKLADASCGSKTCYQVQIDLSAEDLKALIPDSGDVGDAVAMLTILVEKDTLRPASMVVKVTATGLGDLTVAVSISKWDETLNITAPPADQVE